MADPAEYVSRLESRIAELEAEKQRLTSAIQWALDPIHGTRSERLTELRRRAWNGGDNMSVCPSCGVGPTRAHWTTLLLELSRLTKENEELSQSRKMHIATVFKIDKENARLQSELARLIQENYEIRQHCQRCADEQQRLREELARLTQQPASVA